MNKAERSFLVLALCLFALGWGARLGALERVSPLQEVELPVYREALVSPAQEVSSPGGGAVAPAKAKAKGRSSKKAPLSGSLLINSASATQLCALPGVGPALAAKIVAYRQAHGPLRGPKDLDKVPGIGEKKLRSICEWVKFD